MRTQVAVVVDARKQFFQNLSTSVFHSDKCNQKLLPEYEKEIYSEYVSEGKGENLLFVHNHKVQDNIRNLRDHSVNTVNPFEICLDLITYEIREIEGMEEAITTRESYESTYFINVDKKKSLQEKCLSSQAEVAKLTGGKTTFKSLFSRGNKNQQIDQLEKEIPELQK